MQVKGRRPLAAIHKHVHQFCVILYIAAAPEHRRSPVVGLFDLTVKLRMMVSSAAGRGPSRVRSPMRDPLTNMNHRFPNLCVDRASNNHTPCVSSDGCRVSRTTRQRVPADVRRGDFWRSTDGLRALRDQPYDLTTQCHLPLLPNSLQTSLPPHPTQLLPCELLFLGAVRWWNRHDEFDPQQHFT